MVVTTVLRCVGRTDRHTHKCKIYQYTYDLCGRVLLRRRLRDDCVVACWARTRACNVPGQAAAVQLDLAFPVTAGPNHAGPKRGERPRAEFSNVNQAPANMIWLL